jgi:O-antigen ligase
MKLTALVFICGLFLGLVASQSVMDGFLILSTLLGFTLLIKSNFSLKRLHLPPWLYLAIPWFLWVMVGFIIKAPPQAAMFSALKEFTWLLNLPLLVLLWKQIEPDRKTAEAFLIILLFASLYAVIIYALGFDPLQQTWTDRTINLAGFWRSGGFFSNAMALAQSYGPLTILIMPLAFFRILKPSKDSHLLLITAILVSLAVLFTFTRGVWLALAMTTLIGSFVYSRRWGVVTLATLVLGAGMLLMAWPKFRDRTFQSFDAVRSYDSERVVLWKTNWYIFTENPWMGIGFGENKRRLREYYDILNVPTSQFEGHAHNQYLQFLAGTGIIGLLFYLTWCGLFLKLTIKLYRYYEKRNQAELQLLALGLFLAQLSFHLGSFTEANFSIAKNRILMVFIWSFILYMNAFVEQLKSGSDLLPESLP